MTDETATLIEFVRDTELSDVPETVTTHAKRMVLDTTGVTLRGADAEAARIARDATPGVTADATTGGPGLTGTDRRGDAAEVAFPMGVQAHVHDYDDVHQRMGGHPSAPVLSALLPLAEARDASGRDLLRAFVLGTEVTVALGAILNPGHYERGWHPTAVFGAIGATVGSGGLLDLDGPELRRAIGIAVSRAGGSKVNFGTMTKSAHVGDAARTGVRSARLAAAGFTASEASLEADFGGFFNLFEGEPPHDVGDTIETLGTDWHLLEPAVGFKPYPCCGSTHAAVDAVLALREAGVDPEEVRRVTVTEHPRRLDHTDRLAPDTILDAKFSVQYCVAVALATGSVRLEDFTPEAIGRQRIRNLADRVVTDPDPDAVPHEWGAVVVGETEDGREETATVTHPRGSAENSLSDEELDEKYRRCAGHVLGGEDVERSLGTIRALETCRNVSSLLDSLTTA